MKSEFSGKLVIVTGGSQNIGAAICEGFLERGAHVIAADIIAPEADIVEQWQGNLLYCETDVTSEESVQGLMAFAEKEFGGLDVLVNNAGICIESTLQDTSVQQFERVMDINVKGVFLMTKHALKAMNASPRDGAAIINISSIEGLGANPSHSIYAASKGAVSSITRNTALEYGPHGIRCNSIAPGWINTPFNEKFLDQFGDREKVDAEIQALHPVGRLGLPKDIAQTAVWLASPHSGFISGQEIVVDGGRLAKLPLPSL